MLYYPCFQREWDRCCHVLQLHVHPHPLSTLQCHLNLNLWLVLTKFVRGAISPKMQAPVVLWKKAGAQGREIYLKERPECMFSPSSTWRIRVTEGDSECSAVTEVPSAVTWESKQRHHQSLGNQALAVLLTRKPPCFQKGEKGTGWKIIILIIWSNLFLLVRS